MLADLVDYLLHQRFRLLQPAVEQDQTELVTAQPSQAVAVAQLVPHQLGDVSQQASPAAWPAVSLPL